MGILDLLSDTTMSNIDVDGERRLSIHLNALSQKKLLRNVFKEFHHAFKRLETTYLSGREGIRIELGAGVAPIRDTYKDVLATDVVKGKHLDRVIDAEKMDLDDGSVRVVFGQNCFHHFPHPDQFFFELERVLTPGGGAVLLEPYYGPFAGQLYKYLFKTEGFDKNASSWKTPVSGPMCGANQALSYIVFKRDKSIFEQKYPALKIVHQELCNNYLKYLISGGLNFKQLLPDGTEPLIDFIQDVLLPLNKIFCLHHILIIQKNSQ